MKQPAYVVFIDFDGVTHPLRERTPNSLNDQLMGRAWLTPFNVGQVNRLLRELDAVGVISSAWRLMFPWDTFQCYFDQRLVGQTPMTTRVHVQRDTECRLFLEQQGWGDVPWVAIDDKPTLYAPETPLITTNYRTGLRDLDVDKFFETIEKQPESLAEESLCEYYCTTCHRWLVAIKHRILGAKCSMCGATDDSTVREASTFGFMYYQISERGQEEMKHAQSGWFYDDGYEIGVYDKSPLLADAVRSGTLESASSGSIATVSAGGTGGSARFKAQQGE
jgi:hypothetical protein